MLKFIIHRRVTISMLFAGLSLLGYISYKNLPLELLPQVDAPFMIVQVAGGQDSDPRYIEREAVIPLESAISTLADIEKIESFVGRRQGTIYVTYTSGTDIKYAFLKLQEKVNSVQPDLPDGYFARALKVDTDALANMFMNIQVRGTGGSDRIRNFIDEYILEKLQSIDGIANVEVFGGRLNAVQIVLDNERSESYGITPASVRNLIAGQQQQAVFAGHVRDYQLKQSVTVIADYTRISDLENIIVDETRGIKLRDVADIYQDLQEETSISRVNGKESVSIQLVRDTRVNLIELAQQTRQVITDLNEQYASQEIELVIQQDNAEYLETNINLIIDLAIWGGILAVLILWYFIRKLSLVLIVAITIPASVFTAFNFFYAFDISLNSLTLVGVALAIGMLLDNSIVVLENVFRHFQEKKEAEKAVIDAVKQIARSVSAATLTTIAVFLPFIFAENFFIKFIGFQIGVSIISTLLVSLVVSLLLIPMAAFYFLNTNSKIPSIASSVRSLPFYRLFLKTALRFPARLIGGTLVLFFVTIFLALGLSLILSNDVELEDFNLYLTMPTGATLTSTDSAASQLEKKYTEIEEIQDVMSQVYEQEAIFTLKLREDYKDISNREIGEVKEHIYDIGDEFEIADVSFQQPSNSERFRGGNRGGDAAGAGEFMSILGLSASEGAITLSGQNFEQMRLIAEDIEDALDDLSGIARVNVNVSDNRPELHLHFQRLMMSQYGISLSTVASELGGFREEFSTGLTFFDGNTEYDIVIRNDQLEDKDVDDLRELNIPSTDNQRNFALSQISDVIYSEGSSGLNRVNQERRIAINYSFIPEVNNDSQLLDAARQDVETSVAGLDIPGSIAIKIEHDQLELGDFYFLFSVSFLLIYMILASIFESLIRPFIILFTVPLAAIGSLWAIILTGNSLANINVLIGLLILLGIVVNNGIILIDYVRRLRDSGYSRQRALMQGGQVRLRPILITALTTIVAMIPLAMGSEEYVGRIAAPFAITVIGGLLFATVFTLVLIPTVFSGLENTLKWIKNISLTLKLLQITVFIAGMLLIWLYVDSLVWRFLYVNVLIFLIPGLTYFLQQSLRKADEEFIPENQPINISIKNIYKMYNQSGRFIREWRRKRNKHKNKSITFRAWVKEHNMYLVAFGFFLFFTYFYLEIAFWLLVFSILSTLFFNILVNSFRSFLPLKSAKYIKFFAFWIVPFFNLLFLYSRFETYGGLIVVGIIWYIILFLKYSLQKAHSGAVKPEKIKGFLAGIRKTYYKFIQDLPLLTANKKTFHALDGLSLEISTGMFGLLGPNGAGKTTLMRIICGILDQSYGRLYINGIDINEKREELQGLIGYLPQDFGMYENLTAWEFLNYQAFLKKLYDKDSREQRIEYVLSAVHMQTHKHEKIGSFSGGMKQRIGIAQTLLHLPRILVVDEPTAGLDPRERIRFRNLLVELARERVVVFSTHVIEDIASSCDKVAVLNNGRLFYLGKPQEMAGLAENKVWQLITEEENLNQLKQDFNVVHHTRIENKIRVRVLSKNPLADAERVKPTLEDAYLWILKNPELAFAV